jgi:3-hydroxyacyl-CoA dehydrogenase
MFRLTRQRLFNKVVVFGGGTMGGGIAQVTATAGIPVTVVEVNDDVAKKAQSVVQQSLERIAKKMAETNVPGSDDFVKRAMSNLTFTAQGDGAVKAADLVIEAVVEKLEVKQQLWGRLDSIAPTGCVFASNTSSLSIAAQGECTKRQDRFVGLHFFSPVVMMKLVEIVRAEKTDPEVVTKSLAFIKKIGKEPVVCRDTKGFIVNRLLVPLMLEAARLVERGDATVEDVDKAMRLGAGHPMGPFALCDSVGVDVIALINQSWHKEFPKDALFNEVSLIADTAKAGKLGKKSGEGFYKYKK